MPAADILHLVVAGFATSGCKSPFAELLRPAATPWLRVFAQEAGLKAILARLAKGIPSIVGLVYDPTTAITRRGDIDVNGTGGHTVPIVGCSADRKKFLYIDVYQEGSKLKYKGGHAGHRLFPKACDYLGLFEVKRDISRGIDILRSTTPGKGPTFAGSQFLEVVAGPLTARTRR
jgi:hypothetical protein